MKKESKNTKYKQRNILVWNEVAPFYHKRWARKEIGPFNVTDELIKLSKIKSGDNVLDLACGTGLVTKKITAKVGVSGKVFAVDTSKTAISIAKKWVGKKKNVHFIVGARPNFIKLATLLLFPRALKSLSLCILCNTNTSGTLKKNLFFVITQFCYFQYFYISAIFLYFRNIFIFSCFHVILIFS